VIRQVVFLYRPRFLKTLVYMLQNAEYRTGEYLKWYWRTDDFSRVMYRRSLQPTKAARALFWYAVGGTVILAGVGLIAFAGGFVHRSVWLMALGVTLILAYPWLVAHLLVLPLWLGEKFIIRPRRKKLIAAAEKIFGSHPGIRVAVAGSYGKTSMKEILVTVLRQGLNVAATPGNKNVPVSHAAFARKLDGDEDVLIIEYGEGAPGDIAELAQLSHPTHAVITGLAPAHLDRYKTLRAAAEDIFSLKDFVDPRRIYVNKESSETEPFVPKGAALYDRKGIGGWRVSEANVNLDGTSFVLERHGQKMQLKSSLMGKHHIGPLAFAASFAHELGMNPEQIKKGVALTKSHEHRMETYQLAGAWIIDDTYNGNIEGIRAGTELLKELPAQRRIYVTPGLVDQGPETARVHEEMGRLIAAARPDMVVLIGHSVTPYIQKGLEAGDYAGELLIETDPLSFYTNLQLFVAHGDLVMLQNDWPDNYA
jgi:UDP-N-acetylmuramoyl-tripeptide--D-alanyl-D-alanine ligase